MNMLKTTFYLALLLIAADAMNQEEQKRIDEELIRAALEGDLVKVKKAIREGANLNASHEGWTPLMAAIHASTLQANSTQIVKVLLNSSLRVYKEQHYKVNPANPSAKNAKLGGITPLILAIHLDQPNIAKTLVKAVKRRAQLDVRDDEGQTALMYAVKKNNVGLVRYLLASEANPEVTSKAGKKAVDLTDADDMKQLFQKKYASITLNLPKGWQRAYGRKFCNENNLSMDVMLDSELQQKIAAAPMFKIKSMKSGKGAKVTESVKNFGLFAARLPPVLSKATLVTIDGNDITQEPIERIRRMLSNPLLLVNGIKITFEYNCTN